MNILVSPFSGGTFYFRSDSTLIRQLTDFYIPDYVSGISAVPVLCFRCERSGKSIPERFALRFLGPFSCGIILKAALNRDIVPDADIIFAGNALDYSTIIPYDLISFDRLHDSISASKPFTLKINGTESKKLESCPQIPELCRRFAAISRYCSVRTGDIIAFELAGPVPIDRDTRLTAHFGMGNTISITVK